MADPQAQLEHLDRLVADLSRALTDRDWDAMAQLNNKVQPAVEPLMAALETGELEPEPVRLRLEQLQQFIDTADESARIVRKEAEAVLKVVNRNRSAARAYQNISLNPPK